MPLVTAGTAWQGAGRPRLALEVGHHVERDSAGAAGAGGAGRPGRVGLSVERAGTWKPHPRSYAWAAQQLGVDPGRLALVAVHPWHRAGTPHPEVFLPPAMTARDLPALVSHVQ